MQPKAAIIRYARQKLRYAAGADMSRVTHGYFVSHSPRIWRPMAIDMNHVTDPEDGLRLPVAYVSGSVHSIRPRYRPGGASGDHSGENHQIATHFVPEGADMNDALFEQSHHANDETDIHEDEAKRYVAGQRAVREFIGLNPQQTSYLTPVLTSRELAHEAARATGGFVHEVQLNPRQFEGNNIPVLNARDGAAVLFKSPGLAGPINNSTTQEDINYQIHLAYDPGPSHGVFGINKRQRSGALRNLHKLNQRYWPLLTQHADALQTLPGAPHPHQAFLGNTLRDHQHLLAPSHEELLQAGEPISTIYQMALRHPEEPVHRMALADTLDEHGHSGAADFFRSTLPGSENAAQPQKLSRRGDVARPSADEQPPILAPEIGFNVNDKSQAFTDQILSGDKTIETRSKPTLHPYIGQRMGLVRTGKGKAQLVGYVTIGKPKLYTSQKAFDAEAGSHLVGSDSPFHISKTKNGSKWGYELLDVERIEPRHLVNGSGIAPNPRVARKLQRSSSSSSSPSLRSLVVGYAAQKLRYAAGAQPWTPANGEPVTVRWNDGKHYSARYTRKLTPNEMYTFGLDNGHPWHEVVKDGDIAPTWVDSTQLQAGHKEASQVSNQAPDQFAAMPPVGSKVMVRGNDDIMRRAVYRGPNQHHESNHYVDIIAHDGSLIRNVQTPHDRILPSQIQSAPEQPFRGSFDQPHDLEAGDVIRVLNEDGTPIMHAREGGDDSHHAHGYELVNQHGADTPFAEESGVPLVRTIPLGPRNNTRAPFNLQTRGRMFELIRRGDGQPNRDNTYVDSYGHQFYHGDHVHVDSIPYAVLRNVVGANPHVVLRNLNTGNDIPFSGRQDASGAYTLYGLHVRRIGDAGSAPSIDPSGYSQPQPYDRYSRVHQAAPAASPMPDQATAPLLDRLLNPSAYADGDGDKIRRKFEEIFKRPVDDETILHLLRVPRPFPGADPNHDAFAPENLRLSVSVGHNHIHANVRSRMPYYVFHTDTEVGPGRVYNSSQGHSGKSGVKILSTPHILQNQAQAAHALGVSELKVSAGQMNPYRDGGMTGGLVWPMYGYTARLSDKYGTDHLNEAAGIIRRNDPSKMHEDDGNLWLHDLLSSNEGRSWYTQSIPRADGTYYPHVVSGSMKFRTAPKSESHQLLSSHTAKVEQHAARKSNLTPEA